MEVVTMLRVSLWALALGLCAVVSVTSMIAGFPWILVCIPASILGINCVSRLKSHWRIRPGMVAARRVSLMRNDCHREWFVR